MYVHFCQAFQPVSGLNKVINWKLNALEKLQNNTRQHMILV